MVMIIFTPKEFINAEVNAACLPTAAEYNSSNLPFLSSLRVCRITRKILINPIIKEPGIPVLHAVRPPIDGSSTEPKRQQRKGYFASVNKVHSALQHQNRD